jgi:hypothetical protein
VGEEEEEVPDLMLWETIRESDRPKLATMAALIWPPRRGGCPDDEPSGKPNFAVCCWSRAP